MTDTSTRADTTTEQELAEVIAELEQYRERLVTDTLATVQRAKLPKAKAMAQLEPELARIDAMLDALKAQHANLNG